MKFFRPALGAVLFASAALTLATSVIAQTPSRDDEIAALREQIRQLDQKLRVLERKQELENEQAAAAAKAAPKITASDGRIEIASADGANSLRIRGLVHGDYRYSDAASGSSDSFLLRRARVSVEGTFAKNFAFVVQPEFAGNPQILDANVNATISRAFQLRFGRFKVPFGLEQLQSDSVAFFNERSVATSLTPNRDLGLQLGGDLLDQRVNYAIAVVNGVPDGGSNTNGAADFDDNKVVVARVFATPFANDRESALRGLGVGLAASIGDFETSSGRAANYRTDGQQTFFTYLTSASSPADNVAAAGRGTTISPQAYFYRGPFGLLAEYVVSSIEVQRGGAGRVADVKNHGYNLSFGYVLTGENSSYRGLTPKNTFDAAAGTWGAFEIVGRVAGVDIDDTVFTGPANLRLANPNVSASAITTYGVGLNWYLSRSVRANFDLFHNQFELAPGATPATGALISDDENSFISRLQLSF